MPRIAACLMLLALAWAAPSPAVELGDARCYRCHKELRALFAQGRPHAPVLNGECFACHDAHGAARELRLVENVPKLCLGCHELPSGETLHSPVAKGDCTGCHDPHRSAQEALLRAAIPALCTDCHDHQAKPGFAHSRDCLGCHAGARGDPHEVLPAAFPTERRELFSEQAYALCFRCHDPRSITQPTGEAPTGFRDRTRNLHFVHVIGKVDVNPYSARRAEEKKPGFTCIACHAVHGSEQPKAIRESYERDGFTVYRIQYEWSDRYGSCVAGCHKPERYERDATEGVSASGSASRDVRPN